MEFIELFDLQQRLRAGLEDIFPERLWVRAEVSQIQVKSNGHCYMDLSQSEGPTLVAKAKAVIWRSRYSFLSRTFKESTGSAIQAGMTILALVEVNYSELYGLSLVVEDIEPQYTLGEAELERRRTVEKLRKDGLLDKQKELVPALLPYRLAVISARDAAGYGDFCRHLEQNEYGFNFEVVLFEATMQGVLAPQSITDALERVQTDSEGFDAALIVRGGGSSLDLACFDDYGLCFAIANCPVPVYTAIGHDRDSHVADMVAFCSVKTPTALSDVFIDAFASEDERITSLGTRLRLAFVSKINTMASAVDMLESRIHNADPRNVLSRGYTLVVDSEGKVLKSSKSIGIGDKITILFEDGKIETEVYGKF